MANDDRISDLVLHWEQLRNAGQNPSLDELCREAPELRSEVARHIQILQQMEGVLDLPDTAHLRRSADRRTEDLGTDRALPPLPASPVVTHAHYRVRRRHAYGGLGEILLADDLELHRDVALKRISPPHDSDPERRRRFVSEAEITSQLEHPGIVPIYGVGQDDRGLPCYSMRFIRGETLRDAIRRVHGKPPTDDSRGVPVDTIAPDSTSADPASAPSDFASQCATLRQLLSRFVTVCNTVAYAHSRGVIHRDLKPANIMLGPYAETLVVDWGLARRFQPQQGILPDEGMHDQAVSNAKAGSGTQLGSAVGTPGYMSPEQSAGEWDTIGPPSDIYSLGATLYTILVGQSPFHGQRAGAILDQIRRGAFQPPRRLNAQIPRALEAICLRAMATDPTHRYPSALDLAADVEHWLADEPVSAWREPWTVRARRWIGRHRTLVTSGAAALLVAAVVLAGAAILLKVARDSEHAAKVLAQDREAETRLQKTRAEANAKRARATVNKFFTEVSESPELKAHGLEQLRKNLLLAAKQSYDDFVAEQTADPEIEAERGRSYMRLGEITDTIASKNEAIGLYQKALTVFEALSEQEPLELRHRADQAECHWWLAYLYRYTSRPQDAEQEFQRSLEIYRQLAQVDPSPSRDEDVAKLHNDLGMFYRAVGRAADGEAELRDALDIRERLASQQSDVPRFREGFGVTCGNLALLASRDKRPSTAEPLFHKSAAVWRDLIRDFGEKPDYLNRLAITLGNLANVFEDTGRLTEALAANQQAVATLERLTDAHPSVVAYQRQFAGYLSNFGNLCLSSLRLDEAEESQRRSLMIQERLVQLQPDVAMHSVDLAGTCENLALLMHARLSAEELAWWDRAVESLASALTREPMLASARRSITTDLCRRAVVLARAGRHEDATTDLTRARTFADANQTMTIALTDATLLVRRGNHAQATANTAELVPEMTASTPADRYSAATIYALAAQQAAADTDLSSEVQSKFANQYALHAVALLIEARDQGHFQTPARRAQLTSDPDLDALRNREEFRQLVAQVDE